MRGCGWLGLILAVAGCGSEAGLPPATPIALTLITQPAASARSGVALTPAPAVALLDGAGNRAATRGVAVAVALGSGVGTLVGTTEVRTDAAGEAHFGDLRINGPLGPKTLRFSAAGLTAAASSAIDLTAGDPITIIAEAGNNQTAAAGTAVAVPPAVRLADGAGNPVSSVGVTFSVTSGGGVIEGTAATTGPDGIARATKWTLGTAVGANGASAVAGSLQLAFVATGTVGPPAKILMVEGNGQTATIGHPVSVAPAVKVTDEFDNPASGIAVSFTAAVGSVTGSVPQTDANGVAKVGSWTTGLTPGPQTLVASRSAISVTFGATVTHFPAGAVSGGSLTTCAVTAAGAVFCWGDNTDGQLGDGTVVSKAIPTLVSAGGVMFTSVVVGSAHVCALGATGQAWCWGSNSTGQLGDNSGVGQLVPVAVAGGHQFQSLVAGDLHSCGLRLDGSAWCWGGNGNGRLGDSTVTARPAPVAVNGGLTFTSLTAGASHTCGLTATGLFCWGSNGSGRLGDGTTTDRRAPTAVVTGGTSFVAVAAGGAHTCGIATSGVAMCWGSGGAGALGTGTALGQLTPVAVSGTATYTSIAAGVAHTCAITAVGVVHCWGNNGNGRLGDGTTISRSVPTAVVGTFTAVALDVGGEHSCALATVGSAICWGRNLEGQLGDGGTVSALRPLGVKAP